MNMDSIRLQAMDYVANTPPREVIRKAFEVYEQVQEHLCAVADQQDQLDLLSIRSGTVLVLSLTEHLGNPFAPKTLTDEDWKEIAQAVSSGAVLVDGRDYSLYVFEQYAKYIDASADIISTKVSPEHVAAVHQLAEDLHHKADELRSDQISEPDYVEACLWISLEAMVKLLSATLTCSVGKEAQDLLMAVTQMAFEYGRYQIYARMDAQVTEHLEQQAELDQTLDIQLASYRRTVEVDADQFLDLIDNAFEPGAIDRFAGSAALARAAGVPEEQILKSIDDVDAFFM